MKTTLIFSNYDEYTGVSMATIRCRYGEFTGVARLHPEDRPAASSFLGCYIAEQRAIIKALQTQKTELIAMRKAIYMVMKNLEQSKSYDKNSVENRRLRKTYYMYNKQILELKSTISAIEASIDKRFEQRASILKRFAK